MNQLYSVNLWGSDPDLNDDDCWTGEDFSSLDVARNVYTNPEFSSSEYFRQRAAKAIFIQLKGPNIQEHHRLRPDSVEDVTDRLDIAEGAMQAGMAFGIQGYNDYLGYDSEDPYDISMYEPGTVSGPIENCDDFFSQDKN